MCVINGNPISMPPRPVLHCMRRRAAPRDTVFTLAVIDAQNGVTDKVLAGCDGRPQIRELVSKIMDYPKRGLPWKRGGAPGMPAHAP